MPARRAEVGVERAYSGDIYAPMAMGNLVHTSTVLLRRERAAAAGWFDESVRSGEDHEFHLAACRAGRVAFADVPTILYEVGSEDALSSGALSVTMARHFLRTLTRALEWDPTRIRSRIPRRTISHVLADAHRWLGEALIASGEAREGRSHLLQSLRVHPGQPRVAALYAAGFLPRQTGDRLRGVLRGIKGRIEWMRP